MWFERVWIVFSATVHDFLPHNWGSYFPTWVEFLILGGSFSFFFFWFFVFSRTLPVVPMSDIKTERGEEERLTRVLHESPVAGPRYGTGVVAFYSSQQTFLDALEKIKAVAVDGLDVFSPMRIRNAEKALGRGRSPVWAWTLIGGLVGCTSGFALAIYASWLNSLVVGGKPIVAIIPFCIVGFEGTILSASIFNLIGMVYHARLGKRSSPPPGYSHRFSVDQLGVFVACLPERFDSIKQEIDKTGPEKVYVIE
jgi:hypothetical protein